MDLQPPEGALPWPDRLEEPQPQRSAPALDLPDGVYCSRHPSGRLRLVATVRGGQLAAWLRLEDGVPAGYFKLEGSPWFAQRYDREGQLEDFSRDDDTSQPYPAERSFLEWARERLEGLTRRPRLPEWLEKAHRQLAEMSAGDRPPPHPDKVLSGEPAPEDLEERLPRFQGLSWSSPHQCYERLTHYFKWSPALARDFTNFATAACAVALQAPAHETFLYPSWEQGTCLQGSLEEVPLYVRVRTRALAQPRPFASWVQCLAGCSTSRRGSGKLPSPIVWTVPPAGIHGFRLTMTCVELLLRQEATRQTELSAYLRQVDRERFYSAAALAGAFLQSGYATGDLDEAMVGELSAGLGSNPILIEVGEWVHRQCSARKLQASDKPVVHLLGWFINERSTLLHECLQTLRRGELYWAGYFPIPPGWPRPTGSETVSGGALRERADDFQARLELPTYLPGFEPNRFLHRAEVAGLHTSGSPPGRSQLSRQSVGELKTFLKGHPGGSYPRLVAASRWVLAEWTESPRLATLLAHFLLSAF